VTEASVGLAMSGKVLNDGRTMYYLRGWTCACMSSLAMFFTLDPPAVKVECLAHVPKGEKTERAWSPIDRQAMRIAIALGDTKQAARMVFSATAAALAAGAGAAVPTVRKETR